jgi:anti-sigma regulatory factor (Ser/Thr protein kinase)
MPMSEIARAVDQGTISFVLPSAPESVRIARWFVRAALGFHGLGEYADNAVMITSELVTNAIQHASAHSGHAVGVTLTCPWNQAVVGIVVTDSSPEGPVMHETPSTSERGRGLQVVAELSDYWGWHPEPGGKAVYAMIAKKA